MAAAAITPTTPALDDAFWNAVRRANAHDAAAPALAHDVRRDGASWVVAHTSRKAAR